MSPASGSHVTVVFGLSFASFNMAAKPTLGDSPGGKVTASSARYLAKALFLFAVGHVIGSGIGNATNFYAKDSLDSVASSLAGVGGVDQSELLSIMKNVGNEVSKGVDIGLHAAPHLPSKLPNLSALKNVSQEI